MLFIGYAFYVYLLNGYLQSYFLEIIDYLVENTNYIKHDWQLDVLIAS